MIIKSMARKNPSFEQLVKYFHKDQFYKTAPTFSQNLWSTTPETIAEELERNATFLPKRSNGNYLYHECLVLDQCPNVSRAKQERILMDLVEQYIALRAHYQLVYGRMHFDTDHLHFHLCISANTIEGKQRRWITKAHFARIQRQIEDYKIQKYPELGTEKYYDLEVRRAKREASKAARQKQIEDDKVKLTRPEFEMKKRTGSQSQKEQDRAALLEIFQTALSELELSQRLQQLGFETYTRGQTEGVVNAQTGRKYRLKTLGLETALQKTHDRVRVYDERKVELEMARARQSELKQGKDRDDTDRNEPER